MCNAGALSIGTQSLGAATSAIGGVFGAMQQRQTLGAQAYYNDLNAQQAREDARETLRQAEFTEQRQRLNTAQIKSSQRAAMGANGVDLTTGSALDRLVSTDYLGEVDANTIRANAAREAAGHRMQAVGYSGEATMQRAARRGISPFAAGLTSLATSAGEVASDWYALSKVGAMGKTGNKK